MVGFGDMFFFYEVLEMFDKYDIKWLELVFNRDFMISYSYVDKEMMVKLRGEEVLWYKMYFFWIELLFVSISI